MAEIENKEKSRNIKVRVSQRLMKFIFSYMCSLLYMLCRNVFCTRWLSVNYNLVVAE